MPGCNTCLIKREISCNQRFSNCWHQSGCWHCKKCHLSSGRCWQEGQSCKLWWGWNLDMRSGSLSWINKRISHCWLLCWKELRADARAVHWIPWGWTVSKCITYAGIPSSLGLLLSVEVLGSLCGRWPVLQSASVVAQPQIPGGPVSYIVERSVGQIV